MTHFLKGHCDNIATTLILYAVKIIFITKCDTLKLTNYLFQPLWPTVQHTLYSPKCDTKV